MKIGDIVEIIEEVTPEIPVGTIGVIASDWSLDIGFPPFVVKTDQGSCEFWGDEIRQIHPPNYSI